MSGDGGGEQMRRGSSWSLGALCVLLSAVLELHGGGTPTLDAVQNGPIGVSP
jgi:hypothetical protein